MYEIDKVIGVGSKGTFFGLKKFPKLGVKVLENNDKHKLEKELIKGKVLQKLGISVPMHLGIVAVEFPTNFDEILHQQIEKFELRHIHKAQILKNYHGVMWGMLMELIETDITLIHINHSKTSYFYREELKRVRKLGIITADTGLANSLWSEKRQKVYLIDFDDWIFPPGLISRGMFGWLKHLVHWTEKKVTTYNPNRNY